MYGIIDERERDGRRRKENLLGIVFSVQKQRLIDSCLSTKVKELSPLNIDRIRIQ